MDLSGNMVKGLVLNTPEVSGRSVTLSIYRYLVPSHADGDECAATTAYPRKMHDQSAYSQTVVLHV
jgi:hypothetical protein